MDLGSYIVLVLLGVFILIAVFSIGVAVGYEVNKFINEKINKS